MLPSAFYYGRVAIRQSSFAACGVLLPKGTCVAGSGSKKQGQVAYFFFRLSGPRRRKDISTSTESSQLAALHSLFFQNIITAVGSNC